MMPTAKDPLRGELEHAEHCPGPRVVRRDGTHAAQLTCTACEAYVCVTRRTEWRDND